MSIQIGTSGWHYPHWVGHLYPAELGSQEWLKYYARHFGDRLAVILQQLVNA
jgi:uncharacterized protein YecE (DUF72 family)